MAIVHKMFKFFLYHLKCRETARNHRTSGERKGILSSYGEGDCLSAARHRYRSGGMWGARRLSRLPAAAYLFFCGLSAAECRLHQTFSFVCEGISVSCSPSAAGCGLHQTFYLCLRRPTSFLCMTQRKDIGEKRKGQAIRCRKWANGVRPFPKTLTAWEWLLFLS